MPAEPNVFWQANFWGIAGTISGLLGLLISWLNWRYSKPKVELVKLELETPRYSGYKNDQREKQYWITYTLRVRFRNKKGGSGSVEKPLLIIRFLKGKKFRILNDYSEFILQPRTQHTEEHKLEHSGSYTAYQTEVIRHGEAWNIGGGEMVDDELEYHFNGREFYDILQNLDKLEYFVEYHNNFGKKFRKKIKTVKEEYS